MAVYQYQPDPNAAKPTDVVDNVDPGRYLTKIKSLRIVNTKKGDQIVLTLKTAASMKSNSEKTDKNVGVQTPDFWISMDGAFDRNYIQFMESCGVNWQNGQFDTDWFPGMFTVVELITLPPKDGRPARNAVQQYIHPKHWRGPLPAEAATDTPPPAQEAPVAPSEDVPLDLDDDAELTM